MTEPPSPSHQPQALNPTPQVGTLDPEAMAREFARWAGLYNLTIKEVHVLGGGNLRHYSGDVEKVLSQNILMAFVKSVEALVDGIKVSALDPTP